MKIFPYKLNIEDHHEEFLPWPGTCRISNTLKGSKHLTVSGRLLLLPQGESAHQVLEYHVLEYRKQLCLRSSACN